MMMLTTLLVAAMYSNMGFRKKYIALLGTLRENNHVHSLQATILSPPLTDEDWP
jgi:hypothetical protein